MEIETINNTDRHKSEASSSQKSVSLLNIRRSGRTWEGIKTRTVIGHYF